MPNYQIELDESFIYEVEKESMRVRKRCLLKDLEFIHIIDKNSKFSNILIILTLLSRYCIAFL